MNRKGSKMKKFVSFTSIVTLYAVLLCSFGSIEAGAVSYETATSGNVIPEKVSTFESATVGETPDGIKGWDNSGVDKPFTSTNYTVVPTVDEDTAHGKVLKVQPKNVTITPRWAIGSELYAEANKTPAALRYKITVSADIKKTASGVVKLNFKMAATKTDSNFGENGYANVLIGVPCTGNTGVDDWTTVSGSCELTLEQLKNNNSGDYFNIYFTQGANPAQLVYIDNVTATVTPIFETGEDYADGVFCPQITADNFQSQISKYFELSGEKASYQLTTYPHNRDSIKIVPTDSTVKGKRIGIKPEVVSAVTGNKTGVYMLSAEVNSAGGAANTLYAQIGCSNAQTVKKAKDDGFRNGIYGGENINSNVLNLKQNSWTTVNFIFALSEDWLKDNTGIWICQDSAKYLTYLHNITLKRIDVNFSNVSVDLGTSLSLNASVADGFANTVKPVLGDVTKLAVRFTRGGKSVEVEPNADGKFVFDDIAPQCMTENITAELLYTDRQGTKVIDKRENFTIKDYFNSLANDSQYADLIPLLSDTLVYGAEAQKYVHFNEDNLATADVIATADVNWLAPTDRTVPASKMTVTGDDANNKATAAGVYFSNTNRIYFKFVKEDGAEIKLYKNGAEVEYSLQDGNKAYTPDILPTEYGVVFKFVIEKGGVIVYTVEYCINDYIARKYDSASIGALVKAMNNYGGSCSEYMLKKNET